MPALPALWQCWFKLWSHGLNAVLNLDGPHLFPELLRTPVPPIELPIIRIRS
jgi:hypothetical protein